MKSVYFLALCLAVPLAAFDTAKVTDTPEAGGGGTITTFNDIIMTTPDAYQILQIQGVDDLVDRAPTPTPSPTPTPGPQVKGSLYLATTALSYLSFCDYPRYRRPAHPEVIKVDVWTSDGKHWRATKWEEVKP